MPSSNGLTHLSLGQWRRWHSERTICAWLTAFPNDKRVPDETYGVRIDIREEEITALSGPKILELLTQKLNMAFCQLEMYRLDPPPLHANFHVPAGEDDNAL